MRKESIGAVLATCLLLSSDALAQASLIAENIHDSVVVEGKAPDGSTQSEIFTLVRDATKADQWYYYPNRPRLAEIKIAGNDVPELNLIRYTSSTPDGQIKASGLLTFAVTLSAKPDIVEALQAKLKQTLAQSGGAPNTLRLSPIPLNSATAAVFSPSTGSLLGEVGANSIVAAPDNAAPTSSSNKIVFALTLSDVGADIYKALLDGVGGIPVWIRYKFNGLTPPAGFKVTANWEQAYEHYSKDETFRARASYFGWFSANYSSDKTYIRDELLKSSAIKIEPTTDTTFTVEKLDSYLQPIIKRLNETILQDLQPPAKINPAQAETPGTGGYFGGAGYSVEVKDAKDVRKGSETWDFSFKSIVERGGSADGTVGLRGYPEATRKMLVQSIDAGNWDRVYLSMPNTAKIDGAELRARLRYNSALVAEKYFKWTERTGWVNTQGNQPTNGVWISLLSYPNFDRSKALWETQYKFALGADSVSAIASSPLEGDSGGLYAPVDLYRILTVSADGVDFENPFLGASAKIASVDVVLSDGSRTTSQTFRRESSGATSSVTPDLRWIVAKKPGEPKPLSISLKALANLTDGRSCTASYVGSEFADRFPAGNVQIRVLKWGACT